MAALPALLVFIWTAFDSRHLGHSTNLEQLFTVACSACFESPIALAARKNTRLPADVSTGAEVDLNRRWRLLPENASQHQPPGVECEAAQALVDEAHEIYPYSTATRGNIEVAIKLV